MSLKEIIRPLHLISGLIIGLIIIIVSLTGAMYAFEEEIRNLLYKDKLFVTESSVPEKPLSELVDAVKNEYPKGRVKNIRVKGNKESSVEVILKDKLSVYVNPYTAQVLGSVHKETDFFGTVLKLHRTLFLGETGKIITGTSATAFVFMLISGIILWWPKKSAPLKQKISIIRNASWKRLNYDLHSVLGFYTSWILIFTALTGIMWSFKWAENSMYWLSGSKKEEKKQYSVYISDSTPSYSVDRIYETAYNASTGSELFIFLPEDSIGAIRVFIRYNNNGFVRKQDQLFFDQYSGKLLNAKLYSTISAGDKIKAAQLYIHTGKILGFPGQLLVFFSALIAASLPITGFLLWRGRRKVN